MKPTTVTDDLYSFILSDELKSDGLRERSLLKSPLAPSHPRGTHPLSAALPSDSHQAPAPGPDPCHQVGACRSSGSAGEAGVLQLPQWQAAVMPATKKV